MRLAKSNKVPAGEGREYQTEPDGPRPRILSERRRQQLRAARRKYRRTAKGKAAKRRYEASLKGKSVHRRYNRSPRGRARTAKWRRSENGRIWFHLYRRLPEVRLKQRLLMQERRKHGL
ncbi:MAG TPA: hypothetical protein VFB04_05230 [Terriglobales bacterium]|nr:hypothetical protein [Terriglobales bacterium]